MILARLVAHTVGPFAAGAALLALTGAGLWWLLTTIVALVVTYAALWIDHLESETLRKVVLGRPAGQ